MSMGFPKRKEAKNTIMLTSMMDMFTIILVFLLFNFSPDEQDAVNIPKDVSIPSSSSEELISEAVSVTVSQTSIMVDNKVVAKIRNGKHVQARLEGQKIVPLYNELLRHKRLNKFKSPSKQKGKSQEEDSSTVILLQADKRVPFELLDKVLKSAGMAGFPKSRFVVLRRES